MIETFVRSQKGFWERSLLRDRAGEKEVDGLSNPHFFFSSPPPPPSSFSLFFFRFHYFLSQHIDILLLGRFSPPRLI